MEIVLASTSPYRRNLMRRLGLPFQCVAPEVDEYLESGRRARAQSDQISPDQGAICRVDKAQFTRLCIGSDQVACLGDRLLRKPGTYERAAEQLAAASGNLLKFWTGVHCLRFGGFLEPTCCLRSPDA